MSQNPLTDSPRSRVLKAGYINRYSVLTSQEERQISFKEKYKKECPAWNDTLVHMVNYFKNNLPGHLYVLDAGCGNGNYIIDECRGQIAKSIGIDVNESVTEKNICLDGKVIGDLTALPFPGNTFDVVLSLWVLEHLKDPRSVFNEIYRVLKPGGLFMFATPNRSYFPLMVNRFLGFFGINQIINKRIYGREEKDIFPAYYLANDISSVQGLAVGSGFKVRELCYNFDPSYTSFDSLTYTGTKIAGRFADSLRFNFLNAHIIGVLKK